MEDYLQAPTATTQQQQLADLSAKEGTTWSRKERSSL